MNAGAAYQENMHLTDGQLARIKVLARNDYEVRTLLKAYQSGTIDQNGLALLREEAGGPPFDLATIKITYPVMRDLLDRYGHEGDVDGGHGHGHELIVVPGVLSIHDHPASGRPHEIHVMVFSPGRTGVEGWQKVCELGPAALAEGEANDVAPGYVDFLAEWAGEPVDHKEWKNRIAADNGLPEVAPLRTVTIPASLIELARRVMDEIPAGEQPAARMLAKAILAAGSDYPHLHRSYEHSLAAPRVRLAGDLN